MDTELREIFRQRAQELRDHANVLANPGADPNSPDILQAQIDYRLAEEYEWIAGVI
jgi:hypothetical protein